MDELALSLPGIGSTTIWNVGLTVARPEHEFEAFFIANYDGVVRTLTAMTGDRDRATDAAQEAFIKAYAKWSKIRSYDAPDAWVRRVAINAGRDRHRSERRRRRREQPHLSSDAAFPADEVVGTENARQLLASLPRRQREVATLYYFDDRSVAETSRLLGLSEGTVKSHLADARTRLRTLVESKEADL